MVSRRAASWAAAFAIFRAAPLAAQTDFRNLDEGRPTHTEDALPVDRYGFELVPAVRAGGRGTRPGSI